MCVELTCVVFTAICSDPKDSTALGKYLEDERTLRKLKERISIIRHTVLNLVWYGCTESLVLKELELISKRLFLALKEEKRTLKDWPFSSQSRISSILKELNITYESLMEVESEILRPRCTFTGEKRGSESPEPPAKKVKLQERQPTTSHEENGGMDTVDNLTWSSTTFMDGLNTTKCSKSAIDTPIESPLKEDMKTLLVLESGLPRTTD